MTTIVATRHVEVTTWIWCISLVPNCDTLLLFFLSQWLQGYVVTLLAGVYWNQYMSSLLLSCGRAVSSLLWRTPSVAKEEAGGVSVWRLASYMRPYSGRFVAVVVLVVLSSYGETLDGLEGTADSLDTPAEVVFGSLIFRWDGLPSVHWTSGWLDHERGPAGRIHRRY